MVTEVHGRTGFTIVMGVVCEVRRWRSVTYQKITEKKADVPSAHCGGVPRKPRQPPQREHLVTAL